MNLLVSLFCCLVARSRRKRGNRQTDGRTDGRTHLQTKYYNPRCACAPRVNNPGQNPVKPDQYIVRGFGGIGVTTFEDRVNQFAGLCSSLCTLNFVQKCMKFTILVLYGFPSLYLFVVTTLFAGANFL